MRIVVRLVVYTLGLFLLLGYVSYRVYTSPSQVRLRLGEQLQDLAGSSVVVEGATQSLLGEIQVESLKVSAAPVLVHPFVLELSGVHARAAGADLALRFRRQRGLEIEPPTTRVARALWHLERETIRPEGSRLSRWNVDSLARPALLLEILGSRRTQIFVERVEVELRDLAPPRETLTWKLGARDVELRSSAEGMLTLEADLEEGEYWSDGLLELTWSRSGDLVCQGHVEDIAGAERWLPFLGRTEQDLWDAFRPVGSWNVDLEELRVVGGKIATCRAKVHNYDTRVRLGSTGMELLHLEGPVLFTESGAKIGRTETGEPALAEFFHLPVEVEGALNATEGHLKLHVSSSPMEPFFAAAAGMESGAWRSLVSFLRPAGEVEGDINVGFRGGEGDLSSGSVQFRKVSFAGLPFLMDLEGRISFDAGKVVVDQAVLWGVGRADGDVRLEWDGRQLRLELTDLKLRAELPDGGRSVPATKGPGSGFGRATWGWKSGLEYLEVRWTDAQLACALFRAETFSGTLAKSSPAALARGEMNFSGITLAAGMLWPESGELRFRSGKCLVEAGDELRVTGCRFLGEDQALRAQGTVALSGEVDLVVLLSQGPTYSALERLPDDSAPAQWKEAVKGSYRAFRVSGYVSSPQVREIGEGDPAFAEKKAN